VVFRNTDLCHSFDYEGIPPLSSTSEFPDPREPRDFTVIIYQVCELTQDQINNGIEPSLIKVPNDVPTCKLNLFEWLSKTVEQLNIDPACVAHCWESTLLLSAWEHKVQVEASKKAAELFPNLAGADPPSEEDRDAGYMGMPFVNGTDEEWMSWVMEWVRDDASLQRFAPHDASIAP
jgi:hypothetical protein